MKRKEMTKSLTQAAMFYFVKKKYSVYEEIGLKRRGKLRADLVAFNFKQEFIIIEVKSCWQDYTSDTKWADYIEFCDKMYFCISYHLWESKHGKTIKEDVKSRGVGIMVLMPDGKIKVKQNAKKKSADSNFKSWLLMKLAWRGGNSRHNIKRIKKIFV